MNRRRRRLSVVAGRVNVNRLDFTGVISRNVRHPECLFARAGQYGSFRAARQLASASRAPHVRHRMAVRGRPPPRQAMRCVNRQCACLRQLVRIAAPKRLPGSKAGLAFSAARRLDFDRCRSLAMRAGVPSQLAPIRIRQFIDGLLVPDQGVERETPNRPSCPAAPDTSAGFRRSCRARCSPPRLRSLRPRPPPSPRSRRTGPSTAAPSRPLPSP